MTRGKYVEKRLLMADERAKEAVKRSIY